MRALVLSTCAAAVLACNSGASSLQQIHPQQHRRLSDATAVDTCLCHSLCANNLHLCSYVNSRECMCQSNNCSQYPQYCTVITHPPTSPPPDPSMPPPPIDPPSPGAQPPPPPPPALSPPPSPQVPPPSPPAPVPLPAPPVAPPPPGSVDPQAGDATPLVPLQLPDSAPPVMVIQSQVPLQITVKDLAQLDAWAAQNVAAVDAEEGWISVQVANATELRQTIETLYSSAGNVAAWTSSFFFTEFLTVDTAGNEAVQNVATSFWADCGIGGRLCADLSCATFGMCGLASQLVSASEQYNIQLGPQISLKGNGLLQDGNVMHHTVLYGNEDFMVPAFVAYDDLDGILTDKVSTFGLKMFSVMRASFPGRPHVITYSVRDSDGNTAEAARSILVTCAPDEQLCTASGQQWSPSEPVDAYLHCSRDSFCGPSTVSIPDLSPPSISLVGEALLILPVNAVYAKCLYPRPLDSVCDLGAAALDPVEGDLSRFVKVCSDPGSSSIDTVDASSFSQYGVRYCSVNTQSPGVQNVTFWVADSVGTVATVSRVIMVVQPTSPVLQAIASTELSIFELQASVLDPSGQLYLSEDDQALFENLKSLFSEKSVPTMTLRPVVSYSSANSGVETVELPQGTSFKRCPHDVLLNELDGFCDPGAVVTTSNGQDLSARVVACPAPVCFKTGCPGKRFDAVGLAACELDVFADVGTRTDIQYMAYDDSMPANIVTVHRSVVIVAPCKPGQQLCGQDCSSVPCQALSLFYNPVVDPRFIMPDSSIAAIHLPCTGASFASRQVSVCQDADQVGSATCVGLAGVEEYWSSLVKTEVTATACPIFSFPDDANPALACPPCVLSRLTAGSCAPGSYNVIYTYVYPDLDAPQPYSRTVEIHAEQSVTFEQMITVSMEISLLSEIAEYSVDRLNHALQHVMDELWPELQQSIETQYYSNILGYPGQEAEQTQLIYLTLSPSAHNRWAQVGNSPSTVSGAAWIHGMVSNSNASLPWLDPSTVSVSVTSAMLSALQSSMGGSRPLRITWLELGLNDGGMLDAFETTTTTYFDRLGDFQSISTGSLCPMWTDEQVLELSADVVSLQISDVLDRLRVTSQGTSKAVPILGEVDSVIKMQYLGTAWCDVVRGSTVLSQVLALDVSADLQDLQTDVSSSVQLALLTGAQLSDCLEMLNELTMLQAGALPSAPDDEGIGSATSGEAIAVHELFSQVVWQLLSHTGSPRLADNTRDSDLPMEKRHGSTRNLLDSTAFHQPAFDIDNSATVYPAALPCIQELQQDGCASTARVIGHDRSGTTVLGGVLIHQTRRSDIICSQGFQSELSFRCNTLTRSRGIATQVRSCVSEADGSLPGFGSEPARNGQSSLFNPLLNIEDFYNTSNYPLEVDCRKEPRPFQAVPLPGYDPGYPVVFEACADAAVTMRALQYVTDSRYIDEETTSLTVDVLFYNTIQAVYGQFHLFLERTPSGRFSGEAEINLFDGLYSAGWSRFAVIALLGVFKCLSTAWTLRNSDSTDSLVTQRLAMIVDVLTSALLLTADVLWAVAISTALKADFPGWASHNFRIYGNVSGGMRIFMPHKLLQGDPDAPVWSRLDDLKDLNVLAQLNNAMRVYDSLHVSSLVVRGAAVLGMMISFILASSAFGSLQKLAYTLKGALLPILELVISLIIVGSLMASFISTLYFDASQDLSHIRTTLNTITGYGVSGWFDAFFGKIRASSMELTKFEQNFVAVVVRYLTPILLYLLYSRLTITTILLSFRRVKRQLRSSGVDVTEVHSSIWTAVNDVLGTYWPRLSDTYRTDAALDCLVRTQQQKKVSGLTKLIQEVYHFRPRQPASSQITRSVHQLLNMLVPPDVVRFTRTFRHGIGASKSPLGRWSTRVRRRGREELYDVRELLQMIILARDARDHRTHNKSSTPNHDVSIKHFDRILHQCRHVSNDIGMFMVDLTMAMMQQAVAEEDISDAMSMRPTAQLPTPAMPITVPTYKASPSISGQRAETQLTANAQTPEAFSNMFTPTMIHSDGVNKTASDVAPAVVTASSIASVQSLSALGSMSSLPYTTGIAVAQSGVPGPCRLARNVQMLPGIVEADVQDGGRASQAASRDYSSTADETLYESTSTERDYSSTQSSDQHRASVPLELVPSLGLNMAASLIGKVQAGSVDSSISVDSSMSGEPVGESHVADTLNSSRMQYDTASAKQTRNQVQSVYGSAATRPARRRPAQRQRNVRGHGPVVSEHTVGNVSVTSAVSATMPASQPVSVEILTADETDHRQTAHIQLQASVDELASQLSVPQQAFPETMAEQPAASPDMMWRYNAAARGLGTSDEQSSTDSSVSNRSAFLDQRHDAPDLAKAGVASYTSQTKQTGEAASEQQAPIHGAYSAAEMVQPKESVDDPPAVNLEPRKPAPSSWNIVQQTVRGTPLLHVHSIGLLSQAISLNTIFYFGAHLGSRYDGLAMQFAAAEVDRTKEQVRTIQRRRRRKRSLRNMQLNLKRAVMYSRFQVAVGEATDAIQSVSQALALLGGLNQWQCKQLGDTRENLGPASHST